jgi:hypothetical protein
VRFAVWQFTCQPELTRTSWRTDGEFRRTELVPNELSLRARAAWLEASGQRVGEERLTATSRSSRVAADVEEHLFRDAFEIAREALPRRGRHGRPGARRPPAGRLTAQWARGVAMEMGR